MAKVNGLEAEIPFTLSGIPCLIGVESYFCQPPHRGSAWTCDSDMDYYGYDEMDWIILDRKGYKAEWLEKKITSSIEESIQTTIRNYFNNINNDDY